MTDVRLEVRVTGRVQGVGFRYWVRRRAEELGLTGAAANEPDGSVTVIAEGSRDAAGELLQVLGTGRSPGKVDDVQSRWLSPSGEFRNFREK